MAHPLRGHFGEDENETNCPGEIQQKTQDLEIVDLADEALELHFQQPALVLPLLRRPLTMTLQGRGVPDTEKMV